MENISTFRASRLPGLLRYQNILMRRAGIILAIVLLVMNLLSLVAPFAVNQHVRMYGIDLNQAMNGMLILAAMMVCAFSETRFMTIQGTPRWAVFVAAVYKLIICAVGLTLLAAVMNALLGLMVALLAQSMPDKFLFAADYSAAAVSSMTAYGQALSTLPGQIPGVLLGCLEWGALFYCVACFLRRWKIPTLCVLIGAPILMSILVLTPLTRDMVALYDAAQSGDTLTIMSQAPGWMQLLNNIIRFVLDQWPVVLGVSALVSLPVSYLVMSRTSQPDKG